MKLGAEVAAGVFEHHCSFEECMLFAGEMLSSSVLVVNVFAFYSGRLSIQCVARLRKSKSGRSGQVNPRHDRKSGFHETNVSR